MANVIKKDAFPETLHTQGLHIGESCRIKRFPSDGAGKFTVPFFLPDSSRTTRLFPTPLPLTLTYRRLGLLRDQWVSSSLWEPERWHLPAWIRSTGLCCKVCGALMPENRMVWYHCDQNIKYNELTIWDFSRDSFAQASNCLQE